MRNIIYLGPLLGVACGEDPTGTAGGSRERWYQAQIGSAPALPAMNSGVVFFGTGDGQVIARDRAMGVARWATTIAPGQEIGGANLALAAGVVIAPVAYDVFGLDVTTGRKLWHYKPPPDVVGFGPDLPGYVYRNIVDADSGAAYIPAWGASVSAVDIRTGTVRWVWQPGRTPTDTAEGRFRSGSDAVRVSGDTVFATAWHFTDAKGLSGEVWLVALDRASGRELWRVTLPLLGGGGVGTGTQPALWGTLVLFNTINCDQYAVDRRTRQIVWHAGAGPLDPGALQNANLASPAVAGDVVYHDGCNGYLYARRASDGAVLWRTKYAGQFTQDLTVSSRRVYGTNGNQVLVFDRQTGALTQALSQPHAREGARLIASGVAVADGEAYVTVLNAAWSFAEP